MRPILIALLLTATLQAAEPRVGYKLHAYQPGTSTPIGDTIKVGQEFDLALKVQDLRPERDGELRGIYAAYCDVSYRRDMTPRIAPPVFSPFYQSNYPNFPACADLTRPDRIGAMGAFYGTKAKPDESSIGINPKQNTDPIEIVRVRLKAQLPAGQDNSATVFRCSFDKLLAPIHNTLLWGNLQATPPDHGTVKPDEIQATGVTLRITR